MSIFFPLPEEESGGGGVYYFPAYLAAEVRTQDIIPATVACEAAEPVDGVTVIAAEMEGGTGAVAIIDLVQEDLR